MSEAAPFTALVVGEYNVGKTHYGAQLLRRLLAKSGDLRMRSAPTNLKPFEEALRRIDSGLAAAHTGADYAADSHWPVGCGQRVLDLVWPEYGGEQLNGILTNRQMPKAWRERAQASDGWLVLVRAVSNENADDFLTRPLASLREAAKLDLPYRHTSQARVVELLQMLLFARGADAVNGAKLPKMSVVLTCWDELAPDLITRAPREVLNLKMPLVGQFVDAVWPAADQSIVGLSALERALDDQIPNEDFINRGPETFGYVIEDSGQKVSDLGVPLMHIAGWR